MNMSGTSVIIYLACLIVIFIVGKVFFLPIKSIVKLIINSLLGGFIIYIVNVIGASFGFHIGLNVGTALFTGLLGVPGVVFLVILKLFI